MNALIAFAISFINSMVLKCVLMIFVISNHVVFFLQFYMLTYESGEFAYNQGHNIYGTLEQKAALRAIIS